MHNSLFCSLPKLRAEMDDERLIIEGEKYNFLYVLTDCLYVDKPANTHGVKLDPKPVECRNDGCGGALPYYGNIYSNI